MHRLREFLLLVTSIAATTTPALGQDASSATQSASSIPDFSSIWGHPSIPGFEPPASGPGPVTNRSRRRQFIGGGVALVTDPNGALVSNFVQLVGDYTNPILKPQAAEVVKKHGEISLAGVGYPTPRNQCWPGGVPFIFSSTGMQMLQQLDQITIIYDYDHEVRRVRMNQPHPAQVTPSWYGDSVGHYEGGALVIDTAGIKVGPFAMVDWYGTPHTDGLHVVERYRLLDYEAAKEGLERDAKENARLPPGAYSLYFNPNYRGKHLQLQFTVEDDGVFTMPWSATITHGRPLGGWDEYVCAENPHKFNTEKDAAVPTANKPDF
jgi:hypothetical protein